MLTSQQLATLRCLLDRIIPPDEDPGAWEAGVGDYLLRQLAGDLAGELEAYRSGLDALEAEAQARHRVAFTDLPADEQDVVLGLVEAGQVVGAWPTDPARFFHMAVQHSAEGFYSDPGNGGNRDLAAWRMMAFLPGVAEGGPP
jgi:gluconate 2-dehydrogenase gamma chain